MSASRFHRPLHLSTAIGGIVRAIAGTRHRQSRPQNGKQLWNSRSRGVMEESKVKIRIDKARCVGNARCWAIAPDLYPLDDDGYIAIEEFEVPAGQEALARRGARACPERVIEIIEE
jgi:ferredoxin